MGRSIVKFGLGGGLNEETTDAAINPGELRRSMNYAALPNGGYEWIQGMTEWSGLNNVVNMAAVRVFEIQQVLSLPSADEYFTTASFNIVYRPLGLVQRASTTLMVAEMAVASDNVPNGAVYEVGESETITDPSPTLTAAEIESVMAVVTTYETTASAAANDAGGDSEITWLHAHADTLYCARLDTGATETVIQRANPDDGTWVEVDRLSGLFGSQSDNSNRISSYSYQFTETDNPSIFIVDGLFAGPRQIERNIGGSDPSISTINDQTAEVPTHVIVHNERLFTAYPGGHVFCSTAGDPTDFTTDPAEFNVGADVTGFAILPGDSLAIFCVDRIKILEGTGPTNFVLRDHADQMGAIEGSIQTLPVPIFANELGINILSATDAYGNFASSLLTQRAQSLFQKVTRNAKLFSCFHREKSQYRLINSSGNGMYLTFRGNQLVGIAEVDLGRYVNGLVYAKVVNGDGRWHEGCFVASGDGNVWRLDSGRSEAPISSPSAKAYIELADFHYKSPERKKRFHRIIAGIEGDTAASLSVVNPVDGGRDYYADDDAIVMDNEYRSLPMSDSSRHASQDQQIAPRYKQRFDAVGYVAGIGQSQAIRLINEGTSPHVINSIAVHYRDMGEKR